MKKEELDKIIASHDRWLRKRDGKRADLSKKDLCGVNLGGANLDGANLGGANLSGANLSGANLSKTNLKGADLREADLCMANLREADIEGANLCVDDLCGAKLPTGMYQIVGAGSYNRCTTYDTINDQVICGCWNDGAGNRLDSFVRRIESIYGQNGEEPNSVYYAEYMSAISFFKAVKELNKKS